MEMYNVCGDQCSMAPAGKTVTLENAVGMVLCQDITEIVPGVKKGPAFKKGHVVSEADLPHLERLGKRHLFVLEMEPHQMHENDAAELMASALCGPGVKKAGPPSEGKIELVAEHDGLFDLDVQALIQFNLVPEVMCSTIHRYTPIKAGHRLGGTRPIPLIIDRENVEKACAVAGQNGGLLKVRPYKPHKAGVVVTGNEVASGLIEDRFAPIVGQKVRELGSEVLGERICPDDRSSVSYAITSLLDQGADLIITTAGMSVDPDDVTRMGIADAGGRDLVYGSPVLPGAMFLAGMLDGPQGEVPVLGVPACALFYKTTILDLILPRVLSGERFTREKIAALAHGGFCSNCKEGCRFPACAFGRGA
ncbi:MAG: molybdopterin-binding protein [Desulfarculaceae bacterium]|jgi:hypothetical protein